MHRIVALAALALAFAAGSALWAAERPRDPAFAEVKDDPALPRVLLIGDAISIGYTVPVRKLLDGKANVHRIPVNGHSTASGLESLDKWLGDGKWDVIHFNLGLQDLRVLPDGRFQVPPEQYEKNLRDLVARLKKTGARLVWATTTPVPPGEIKPLRRPRDVVAYNEAAARIMEAEGVATDDLYALALPRLAEIQIRKDVHFKPAGYEKLAEQVAASIRQALEKAKQ